MLVYHCCTEEDFLRQGPRVRVLWEIFLENIPEIGLLACYMNILFIAVRIRREIRFVGYLCRSGNTTYYSGFFLG
ncbi:hypothetical protein HRI_001835600 [Hibiscus trionum]|uniref:Uncharacterized protein n=1 Tax=Hibiscus trionum TaxID=183268 RepID=A0A9W7LZ40_HIBTR|nr:hypothetical protein HRI_001835600 [Hibiscus trionum]